MEALFASGRIVDAILLLVAIEALILIPWRRGAGAALSLLCNLASGVALMLALRPDLISVCAGGNDILAVRSDMPAIMERYEAALQRLVGSGAQVLLFTTFDVKISTALEPLRRRIVFYNDAVRELARQYGCLLVDHTQFREFDDPRMWAFDRIHMSRLGHKHLAAYVLAELGIPHTLKLPELPPFEAPHWRESIRTESRWLATEVIQRERELRVTH